MNPSGWLPGITDAALAHPKEYARGSIGTTEREGYLMIIYNASHKEVVDIATARRNAGHVGTGCDGDLV